MVGFEPTTSQVQTVYSAKVGILYFLPVGGFLSGSKKAF